MLLKYLTQIIQSSNLFRKGWRDSSSSSTPEISGKLKMYLFNNIFSNQLHK